MLLGNRVSTLILTLLADWSSCLVIQLASPIIQSIIIVPRVRVQIPALWGCGGGQPVCDRGLASCTAAAVRWMSLGVMVKGGGGGGVCAPLDLLHDEGRVV